MATSLVRFKDLKRTDLIVDAVYEGDAKGHRGDDPLHPLLSVGNAGGFRYRGSPSKHSVTLAVLYTSGQDPFWPDYIDERTGVFTYHGDQKTPGRELHDTPRKGNYFLRWIFAEALNSDGGRLRVPPLFLFQKAGRGADVIFKGLLVPGAPSVRVDEQLVALWRSGRDGRFQNYRALFTVLDAQVILRPWIDSVLGGEPEDSVAPAAWLAWRDHGAYRALTAPSPLAYRTREQQSPSQPETRAMINTVYEHFKADPTAFERCAAALWQMMAPAATITELTRPVVDGGRDAIGYYSLGPDGDPVHLSFSLEAKCYSPDNAVGTRDLARLISRIRHREFGVLVTTSFLDRQAYRELRSDQHPVVVMAGGDIVKVLRDRGIGSAQSTKAWLESEFPLEAPGGG
ncbi:MAG: restriction endonuclease [Candidatus Nanopelagicales bacterium]